MTTFLDDASQANNTLFQSEGAGLELVPCGYEWGKPNLSGFNK